MIVDETEVSTYSCRLLRIEKGGATAIHSHLRMHVVLALSGVVRIQTDQGVAELRPGMTATVPGNTPHKFVNTTGRRAALLVQNLFPRVDPHTTT
jgi:quercetin dioxygenase-like cupin family protein